MNHRETPRIEDGQEHTSHTGDHACNECKDGKNSFPSWVLDAIHTSIVSDMMSGKYGTSVSNSGDDAADDEQRFQTVGADIGDEAIRRWLSIVVMFVDSSVRTHAT